MAGLAEFRAKNPAYEYVDDATLSDALYKKYYSKMPRAEFDAKMGSKGDNAPAKVDSPAAAPAREPNNAFFTGINNAGDALSFGLTRRVPAAIGAAVSGKPYKDVLADIDAQRATDAEAHPIAAPVGYVAGTVGNAAGISRAAVGAVPALATVAGQGVRNVGRLMGLGATEGAAQAAGEGSDIATGAVTGAIAGPVAAGVGKLAVAAGRGVRSMAGGAGRNLSAARILGKRFNLTPEEMRAALDTFQTRNGRAASLADIADLQSRGQLKQFAEKNPAFGAEVAGEVERRAAQPPQSVTGSQTQASDASSIATMRDETIRNVLGDAADPAALRNRQIATPQRVQTLLESPAAVRAMRGDVDLHAIVDDLLSGNRTSISVDDFENLRQQLRAQARSLSASNAIRSRAVNDLADEIEQFATTAEPRYGAALDRYRQDSNVLDAFEQGRKGRTQTAVTDPDLQRALATPEGRQAYRTGTAERRAAENVEAITPSYIKPAAGIGAAQLGHAAVAAAKAGSAWAPYHVLRAIPGIKAHDATLRLAARYLTDPTMARQGVALLRRSGATDEQLAALMAAVGGKVAADVAGGEDGAQ